MSATEDLIKELSASSGDAVDGTFTLDRDRAREKMRLFQLPDPRSYVAELVAAASLAGARRVRFDIDADDMRLRFDGAPFAVEDFDHLWGSLLSSSSDASARRALALGLNAAMALSPAWVRVESGPGDGPGAFLEMRPGQEDHFGELDKSPGETRIHVKHRLRPGLVVRFVRNVTGTLPEEQFLRQRCRYSTVEVDLEGTRLSRGLTLSADEAVIAVDLDKPDEGLRGQVGFAPDGSAAQQIARLELVRDSLWFTTEEREALLPGLVAVVEGDRLRKNVSQTDVVRDERFMAMFIAVERSQLRALTAYARWCRDNEDSSPRRLEELWRHLLHLQAPGWRPPEGCEELLEVPLLRSTTGLPVSLGQLDQERQQRDQVGYTTALPEVELPSDWPPLIDASAPHDEELLRRLMGDQLVDCTFKVARLRQRYRNRQRWLARPQKPELPTGSALVTVELRGDGITGQLGLRTTYPWDLQLGLIKEGHLLETRSLAFPVPGLTAMIEADFTPTNLYDGVRREWEDETYRAVAEVLVDALPGLLARAASQRGDEAEVRQALLSFLALACREDGRRQALENLSETMVVTKVEPTWPLRELLERPEMNATPLLPCWDGRWMSLQEMTAEIERYGQVRVVGAGVAPLDAPEKVPETLWRHADQLTDDDQDLRERPALLLTPEVDGITAALIRPDQQHAVSAACSFLSRAEQFEQRARSAARTQGEAHRWSVPIDAPRFTGSIWLDLEAEAAAVRQVLIESDFSEGTTGALELTAPIGGLNGRVESTAGLENLSWGVMVEGSTTEELRWAVYRALPKLIQKVGENVNVFDDRELQRPVLEAIGAIFPGPGHRRAYDLLRKQLTPERAEAEYRALLEMGATVSHERLETRLARWSPEESLPTTAALREELSLEQHLFGDPLRDAFEDEPPAAPPGALAWLEVLFPAVVRDGQTLSFAERALEPIEALRTTKVFRDLDRTRLTLAPLIDDHDAQGEVLHVEEPLTDHPPLERPVVLLDDSLRREVLERLFGPTALREASSWIEERKKSRYRDRLPQLDEVALAPDEAIVAAPIDHEGITGEVGLPRKITEQKTPTLTMRLCTKHRVIGEQNARSMYIDLVAILDDDQLVMSETWETIVEDPRREERVALCGAALPQLSSALADIWDDLDEADLEVAAGHALDLLAMRWVASGGRSEAFDDEPWQTLSSRPLLASVDGRRWSIVQLREYTGIIAYRLDRAARGELLDPNRFVLAIDDRELHRLEELGFKDLKLVPLESWRKEQKLVRWRAMAPPMPEPGSLPALHRLAVTDIHGLEGELFIPTSPSEELKVCFGFFGRQVEQRPISKVLPCAGVITGSELPVSQNLDAVALTRSQAAALEHQAFRLYDGLASRFVDGDLTEAQASHVRPALADIAVVLVRQGRPEWQPLLDKLETLDLLEPEPAAAEPETQTPALPVEARLLEALRRELVRLRQRNGQILSDFNLGKLELERLDSPLEAVHCRWDQIVLNSQNQGVRRVLERFEQDPLWLAFLASAVYTAVNSHLEQVTDGDEAQFHHELAESVLQR